MKTRGKIFTLLSGCVDGWSWRLRTRIWNDETFHFKGFLGFESGTSRNLRAKLSSKAKNSANKRSQKWRKRHPEQMEAIKKKWRDDNPEKVKDEYKRHSAKRKGLGFIELDESFEGSNAHHIDKDFVLHIPGTLHQSVPHNVWTGQGMEEINNLAWEWVCGIKTEAMV